MSRRSWKKTSKSMESQLQDAKEIWSFPTGKNITDEELQKELMEEFYGAIQKGRCGSWQMVKQ